MSRAIQRSRGTGPRATGPEAASPHRRARACPSPCFCVTCVRFCFLNNRGGQAPALRCPGRFLIFRRARACPSPCLAQSNDRGGQAPALRCPGRFLSGQGCPSYLKRQAPALRCPGCFLSPALRHPGRFMHAHYLIPTRIDDFDGHLPMLSCRKWQRYRPTQLLKTFRINDTLQRTRNF